MFGFGKNKKKSIPPITDELLDVIEQTVMWCRSQLCLYFGRKVGQMPDLGFEQDILVGSYVCGFIQGQLITNGRLRAWARGDDGLEAVGFLALASSCLTAVLGPERSVAIVDYLPQLSPARGTVGVIQMDEMGGLDGTAHAQGALKQKGGLLNFYLMNNLEDRAAKQEGVS